MIEMAVQKRKAKYAGEFGFFPIDSIGDDEIKKMPNDDAPLWAEITTPANIKLLRLLWAIAQKLADGGLYYDKGESMVDLKIRARWADFGVKDGQIIIVPRSLSRVGRAALSRLADRFVYIVCSELLPGMEESKFRAELEDILA